MLMRARKGMLTLLGLVLTGLALTLGTCEGKVYMTVSPYPARVYENAPAGVQVLTVKAYDNVTGTPVTSIELEKTSDAEYFRIGSDGILETNKTIDRPLRYRFQFFVFAIVPASFEVEYKHIMVEIYSKNMYPPTFSQSDYTFCQYRYADPGLVIGSVTATDLDTDQYNSHFVIYPQGGQSALSYVQVRSSGEVVVKATPPQSQSLLQLVLLAVDSGSPPLTGNTTVYIAIEDVKQPDTFCVATTDNGTTLCWKNPMPGRNFTGFQVQVQGQNLTLTFSIPVDPTSPEFCFTSDRMTADESYMVNVTMTPTASSTTCIPELTVEPGTGFSPECTKEHFQACSFLKPCINGATCIPGEGGGLNYTCICPSGWQGTNCTREDLCTHSPCQNQGQCIYQGHQRYTCVCPDNFFGYVCQHRNICSAASPCQNGGRCHTFDNGTYSCSCPDHFTGTNCSLPDPCSPSPCGTGGDCIKVSETKANCSCYIGRYGSTCSEFNICEFDSPCRHGQCLSIGNSSFICNCMSSYTGAFCDTFNPCSSNPCQNNATCRFLNNGQYNCTCSPGYYGDECQHYNRYYENPCNLGTCPLSKVYMTVSPYPARVYENAPAGVQVLTVKAYDNVTGTPVTSIELEKISDAEYFRIGSDGILETTKTIDRPLRYRFQFFVFAIVPASFEVEYKHVMVEVSSKNMYPPTFSQSVYSFCQYRYADPGLVIGSVNATDLDTDQYNSHFVIYPQGGQSALSYVQVRSSGEVVVKATPPQNQSLLQLVLLAVDSGFPPLTGNTTVSIFIEDVKQPDKICVATTDKDTTLCWKNPMPGRNFTGFHVQVQGQNLTLNSRYFVDHTSPEFCFTSDRMVADESYMVNVTVTPTASSTTCTLQLAVEPGTRYSPECMEEHFQACSFLKPCRNGATCIPGEGGGLNFTCICPSGWQGTNCTREDPCTQIPCKNQGQCMFQDYQRYTCVCPDNFFGDFCQHRNICSAASPCQNGGRCHTFDNGTYSCSCPDHFTGTNCSLPDPCSPSPCGTGGDCIKVSETKANCSCYIGRYGSTCSEGNICEFDSPCRHGQCLSIGKSSFICNCTSSYTGVFCDTFNPCSSNPCQNNATCHFLNNGQYNCTCSPGYYGDECQHYHRCYGNPCKLGRCNENLTEPLCSCPLNYDGDYCERYDPCLNDPCGGHGDCVVLTNNMTQGGANKFRCECEYGYFGSQCQRRDPCSTVPCKHNGTCTNLTDTQFSCQLLVLDLMEAGRRLSLLSTLTSNPSSLGAADVDNITSELEELYSFTLIESSIAEDMMNVISNLADVNSSITITSNKIKATSDRLLKLLNDFSADVIIRNGSNVTMTSPNFEVVAVDVHDTASDVMYTPSIATGGSIKQLDVTITLPRQALELARGQGSSPTVTRVQLAGHRKSQFFIPNDLVYSDDVIQTKPVITASIKGRKIVSLTSPVVYKIRNLQPTSNYTCVFWDPNNHAWSTEGVVTVVQSGNYTECQSTHLTSFAVLLDPSPDFDLSSTNKMALTYISYIGSGLSLLCLVITTITYSLFRNLNKDKSGKILLNLCVALLLLNVVFLANGLSAGSDSSTRATCTAVAVILHYLLLASLAWMLVEAVEMYRALVTVFSKYTQCYMLKRCVVGWGVPVLIVAITLGVSREHYQSNADFCFLSRSSRVAYYASLVAPACLVLLVNTVIFIMVTRVVLKPRFQQEKNGKEGITPGQVRGAFTVMFLLGVTWVFGPLAINEAKVVFNYLFCILNSLQGFLIFVFRCLFNPEARLAWVQLITTCTLKKRREPIRSAVYSDSSSKSDSQLKSSAEETLYGRHGGRGHEGSGGHNYVADDRL